MAEDGRISAAAVRNALSGHRIQEPETERQEVGELRFSLVTSTHRRSECCTNVADESSRGHTCRASSVEDHTNPDGVLLPMRLNLSLQSIVSLDSHVDFVCHIKSVSSSSSTFRFTLIFWRRSSWLFRLTWITRFRFTTSPFRQGHVELPVFARVRLSKLKSEGLSLIESRIQSKKKS